jgi:hypothetical protein
LRRSSGSPAKLGQLEAKTVSIEYRVSTEGILDGYGIDNSLVFRMSAE